MKEATIPQNVKYIGEKAFYGCLSLEKVTIKNPEINLYEENIFHTLFLLDGIQMSEFIKLYNEYHTYYILRDEEQAEVAWEKIEGHYIGLENTIPLPILTMYGYEPSTAKVYAEENDMPFRVINGIDSSPTIPDDPVEPDTPDEPEAPDVPDISDTPDDPCSCKCHGNFIQRLIFKITNFFQKIFGQNKVCTCGVKH